MKTAKPLGYILYEGPSQIDGAPIVVIVNKIDGSDNAKTGAMVQTFIIRSDVAPTEALRTSKQARDIVIADHASGHQRRVISITATA